VEPPAESVSTAEVAESTPLMGSGLAELAAVTIGGIAAAGGAYVALDNAFPRTPHYAAAAEQYGPDAAAWPSSVAHQVATAEGLTQSASRPGFTSPLATATPTVTYPQGPSAPAMFDYPQVPTTFTRFPQNP
jgi:hypothetical protein